MTSSASVRSSLFPLARRGAGLALSALSLALLGACGAGSDSSELAATADDTASVASATAALHLPARKDLASLTAQANLAQWGGLQTLPLTPVSMSNLPDGRVMLWSAEDRFGFGADGGRTYSVIVDPVSGAKTERLVTETGHDMFCPGTSLLADGRLLVNGGLSVSKTSLYDAASNTWSTAAAMNIPRGYNASAPMADGSVLTLGGSWSGGVGGKHAELFTLAGGWRRLSGVPIDPMLSVDSTRNFGMDSHLWLIPSGNGKVLHAGPGVNMNWIDIQGNGRVIPAGTRGNDEFSISGNTVMIDAGKVLKTGGGPGYDSTNANANSFIIDTTRGTAAVRRISSMAYRRAFHNSVVLPNGQVVIIGGQTYAVGFSDANSVLVPELFDPSNEAFVPMAPIAAPRNYHSVAVLLPDGRVMSSGGGLCGNGCAANHSDYQILTPPYLYNANGTLATRPVISNVPRTAVHGQSVAFSSNTAIVSASIVRLSSTTHTVNNDQRRLSLTLRATGNNTWQADIPSNAGWAVPGEYMFFAFNASGVPSVSMPIRIGAPNNLWLKPVDDQVATVGAAFNLALSATASTGAVTYGASGLPDGLGIDPATGRISGTPTRAGDFLITISALSGAGAASWTVPFTVREPGQVRFVKFEALSEVAGNPWASMAEFELLDDQGRALPRTGWTASADSAEVAGENGAAANAIDGNPATLWHTQWQAASPAYPHWFVVNMNAAQTVGGFRYTPRAGGGNGTVATYRIYFSADGVNWGTPVNSGDLRLLGAAADTKTVYFGNLAQGRAASQSSSFAANYGAALAVDGNVDGTLANGSTTHTNSDANAWWEVDLGSAQALHTVRLWNRADCCAERLTDFYVLLSPTPMNGRSLASLLADATVTQQRVTAQAGRPTTLAFAGSGRYLRVQLAGSNFLSLAEVEAYGRPAVNRAPNLVVPTPASISVGAPASLQLSATDPDGDALSYSASGLPAGMSINTGTGLISGTPGSAGSYTVQIAVADGRGGSASGNFIWSVINSTVTISPVAAPAIASGGNATYTASATGGGLQYSWNFGDGSAATGWTTSNTISHGYASAGVYTVVLSVRDSTGTVTTRSFSQAVLGSTVYGRTPASGSLAYEVRSGANGRLWAVNPDNDSVSVFDAVTLAKLAEVTVGSQPRTVAVAPSGRIWVVNKGSATISLIDPAMLSVAQTITLTRGSLPYGIVIGADGNAYVALEGTGRVLKINSAGSIVADVAAPGVRHLALSLDGTRLITSRFITAPQPGESTATVATMVNGAFVGGEVCEFDPATMALRRKFVLRHSDKPDTTVGGRGVPNYLGAAAISPDGRSAWIPSKQDNIQRGVLRDGQALDFQNTVRSISSRLDLVAQSEDYAGRVDHDNSGFASAASYHPNGAYVFVALETSRHVAVLDAQGKRELFRVDAGRAPQSVTLSPDGRRLFVANFMDRSVGVYDLGPLLDYGDNRLPLLSTLKSVATEKLAASVLLGKQLFYDARDPRLARDGYMSCASCHNDGGHDGRTWDLTGFGEGLRNTINLRGRAAMGHGFLHWSANFDELQDFEGQIRGLSAGTGLMTAAQFATGTRSQPLGDRKTGVSADLDALAGYVTSLNSFGPSPFRPSASTLSTAAQKGAELFQGMNCAGCHAGSSFTLSGDASQLKDVGTIKPSSGKRLNGTLSALDVPTLRDVWATAPYLHDGSAPTLVDAINAHRSFSLAAGDVASLAAYLSEVGSDEATAPVPVAVTGTACAAEGATCTIPAGRTATVYYMAAGGVYLKRTGVSGSLSCSNATFGDPAFGATKSCVYVLDASTGTGTGLLGQYFGNLNLSGTPLLQRVEAPNFDWGTGSPGGSVPVDNFTVRWSGTLEAPASGTATLQIVSDDGVRVWFDGKLVIDDWTPHAAKANNATVTLTAGQRYAVMIEYYEAGGFASAKLNWQLPGSTGFVAVPAQRLYPASAPATTNLAQGRVASQASTGWSGLASRAVDGNTNGAWNSNSVTHTLASAAQDWWQVDLAASRRIDLIQLWNRSDCCSDRLQNFVVMVSATNMSGRTLAQLLADPAVIKRQVNASVVTPTLGIPVGANGRYVRVQLIGTNYLSLAEVQVFGQ